MEIRYSRGGFLGWIQERWFEFRQGHGTYLGFVLPFVNFVLISYNLFLEQVFSNLTLFQFCLIFGSLYVPAGIIIGRLHIRNQIRYDTGMAFNVNPGLQAMMSELKEIKKLLREHISEEHTPRARED